MRRALLALVTLALVGTGVALATPVPVLAVRGPDGHYLGVLAEGEQLRYSYRQSIYGVTVTEEFERRGDALRLRRVLAPDIRAIEYFRWETPIRRDDGSYVGEPPPTLLSELVIRITPAGEQRLDPLERGWSVVLLERFGEAVVRVTPERTPLVGALAQGLHW